MLLEYVDLMTNGSLTLEKMNYIIQGSESFNEVLTAFLPVDEIDSVRRTLETRITEVDGFNALRNALQSAVEFCGEDLSKRIGKAFFILSG